MQQKINTHFLLHVDQEMKIEVQSQLNAIITSAQKLHLSTLNRLNVPTTNRSRRVVSRQIGHAEKSRTGCEGGG